LYIFTVSAPTLDSFWLTLNDSFDVVIGLFFCSVLRQLKSFQAGCGFSSCDVVLFEGGFQFILHMIWENSLVVPAGSTSTQQCLPPKHPTTT
jgi:hypothetical protein